MNIAIVAASKEDQKTIQNLGRFYAYEMSRYCGFLPGWEMPPNGLYECRDFSNYWTNPHHYPFIIKVDDELAGFALINKAGSSSDVDWNMGEFFIVAKFQKRGVGRNVAERLFNQFEGTWEVMQMPANQRAIDFWENVVEAYTQGNFHQSQKMIPEPKPHEMVVLKFHSPQKSTSQETYEIYYKEQASIQEEGILFKGIMEEASKAKGMGKIQPFAFFIRNKDRTILGGVKGTTYYGCLYVDSLWIYPESRHQGWGSKLIQYSENLGRERQCTFVSLTTMDWEALPFYQNLGYQIEYVREGFENGSKMFVLRKSLNTPF